VTQDHRPIIGPTPVTGLYVNTGYSGHGVMAGAGGSAILIDILIGARAQAENPFRPDRRFLERETDAL
jgi:glycine/D-amino acid oxidase-like deaminating enzyme